MLNCSVLFSHDLPQQAPEQRVLHHTLDERARGVRTMKNYTRICSMAILALVFSGCAGMRRPPSPPRFDPPPQRETVETSRRDFAVDFVPVTVDEIRRKSDVRYGNFLPDTTRRALNGIFADNSIDTLEFRSPHDKDRYDRALLRLRGFVMHQKVLDNGTSIAGHVREMLPDWLGSADANHSWQVREAMVTVYVEVWEQLPGNGTQRLVPGGRFEGTGEAEGVVGSNFTFTGGRTVHLGTQGVADETLSEAATLSAVYDEIAPKLIPFLYAYKSPTNPVMP